MPYLDHAGATLPSEDQMREIAKLQPNFILANPHSNHVISLKTRQIVDSAKLRILHHFNTTADHYCVVFTQNTTHALKIVAENFKFSKKSNKTTDNVADKLQKNCSQFAYLYDSHHSIVGLRHVVIEKVDSISCVNTEVTANEITETDSSLFMLTAMSNFCGKKYDLNIISGFQEKGWSVCLDAAGLVGSSSLDLSTYQPDFVAFSFYKMFGYPTGVGALLIKKSSIEKLSKNYFSGGTVRTVDESTLFFIPKDNEAAFENGTLNYYGISQLKQGFEDIEKHGGMDKIRGKTYNLLCDALTMLKNKKHSNSRPIVEIYSQSDDVESIEKQGPIIAFNLKCADGQYYGYSEVEKICAIFGIALRTGCFCNIGACRKYLNITSEDIRRNLNKGKKCGDEMDLINRRPTGAIRISFGRQSTKKDIDAVEQMIDTCFTDIKNAEILPNIDINLQSYQPEIIDLFSFPIKSCGSQPQNCFELTPRGFKYDREFMITQNDITLNLKTHPELCRLQPTIFKNQLKVRTYDENSNLIIPFDVDLRENTDKMICKNRVATTDCGDEAGKWLDNALELSNCRLLRVSSESSRSFVNDSPYLIVNEASLLVLSRLTELPLREVIRRFRANIVIRGLPPFAEDSITKFQVDDMLFEVTDKCTRCEMICVDSDDGTKDPSLLLALRSFRAKQKMTFGIYVRQKNFKNGDVLSVGMMLKLL